MWGILVQVHLGHVKASGPTDNNMAVGQISLIDYTPYTQLKRKRTYMCVRNVNTVRSKAPKPIDATAKMHAHLLSSVL